MIYAHLLAEHAPEAGGELRGEGYFGHEVQHLPASRQYLTYEFDVNLGFAARCYAVEQADFLFSPNLAYLIAGFLLRLAQGAREGGGHGLVSREAFRFHLETLQEAASAQGGVSGVAASFALRERLLAHALQERVVFKTEGGGARREVEIAQQELLLRWGAAERIEGIVEGRFVEKVFCQPAARFAARLERGCHALHHLRCAQGEEAAHGGQEVAALHGLFEVCDADAALVRQGGEQGGIAR